MDDTTLEQIINNISDKLPDEQKALIQDDLGTLIAENSKAVQRSKDQSTEIERLNGIKEKLIESNSALFQQVGQSVKNTPEESETEEVKPFNFASVLDGKGNFKL